MEAWQATAQTEQGNAIPNPSVTVYQEDGVTLADIYFELGAEKPNPFVGDAEGFIQFWAKNGVYKVVGTDGNDQSKVWEVQLGQDKWVYSSHSNFINSRIPSAVIVASALVGGVKVSWKRDASGTVGPTADGGMWSPADGWISPLHWGAVGDNVADDTAAINSAFDYVRTRGSVIETDEYLVTVRGFGRKFRANGRIDASLIWPGRGIKLSDMVIESHAIGEIAFDLSGSRYIKTDNFNVLGDESDRPWSGVHIGRTDPLATNRPCTHIDLSGTLIDGYFSGSAFVNIAAEEIHADVPVFWNRAAPSGGALPTDPDYKPAYGAVFDGRGRFPGKSPNGQTTTRQSFTMNHYVSANIRKPYGVPGPTIYWSDAASIKFTKPYFTNGGGAIFDWFLFSDFKAYSIEFEGLQVETTGNNRIANFIPMSGNVEYSIESLVMTLGNVYSSDEFFLFNTATSEGTLRLSAPKIHIPRYAGANPLNGVFNPVANFRILGTDMVVPNAAAIGNANFFADFTGVYYSVATGILTERKTVSQGGKRITGLNTHADNAAALTAGKIAGDLYIRTGHGLDVVV